MIFCVIKKMVTLTKHAEAREDTAYTFAALLNKQLYQLMKKSGLVLIAVLMVAAINAQSSYKSAIGGRFGTTYYDLFSVSFKTFITKPGALEFNAGFGSKSYEHDNKAVSGSVAIAYQHHFPIGNIEGFKWYIGGGAVVYNSNSDHDDYNGFGFGVFPTGGVDYKIGNIPLNVSADLRPTIFVTGPGYYNSYYGNFGIAARYTF
jgi:hypothetical protein